MGKNLKFNYKKYWNKNEKYFLNEQKVGMLLQKRTDTRVVGISNNYEEILYIYVVTINTGDGSCTYNT